MVLLGLVGYYFLVPASNGTSGGIISGFKGFFPFGGSGGENSNQVSTTTNQNNTQTPQTPENFNLKLRKLSKEPVSGAGTLDIKAGTVVRYIEKATGHIYEVELFSPQHNRISNTTIPVVYDAIWGNKNNSLVARYLKDDNQTVDTYSLTVKATSTSTENTISGIAFPGGISDVSVFDTNIFYLQQGVNTSSGYISSFDGTKKKMIWNSDIKELLSQFVNTKTVALTTKPAQNVPGFLYFVDTTTGAVKKILGNISGLSTSVSPDATKVLYLIEGNGDLMYLLDTTTKTSTVTTPTTSPEKCVWSKKDKTVIYCAVPRNPIGGDSLTLWYKGFQSFSDDIWKYDIKNNTASIVENLSSDAGESIDVIKPILSDSEQYLVFMNKTDNSLWSLDLTK